MNTRCAFNLCVIALMSVPAFPNSGMAQAKSLKDQIVGTWIYVSSTGKREDGSPVQRPSLQGAVTYTADGRFHFITVRTDAPKYASSDPTRRSAEEAMAITSAQLPTLERTLSTKAPKRSMQRLRRAHFPISSDRPIRAGSSPPLPRRN